MSKIFSIANQKGGVAKTTTVMILASGLQRRGYKVLALDLDPQGNLSDNVGADIESVTIRDVLKNDVNISGAIQHCDLFDIIPSNILLSGIESEFTEVLGKEYRVREVLSDVRDFYDYIFIDTPPSLNFFTSNAFVASDKIIIPCTPGRFAVQGIQKLIEVVNSVKRYCNSSLEIDGILLTKFNPRYKIHGDLKELLVNRLAPSFNISLYKTEIRNAIAVEEAQAMQMDIFNYSGNSKVSEDYEKFVNEFLERHGEDNGKKI